MADVFISYKSEDRDRVALIAQGLEAEGFDIWWDTALRSGETYDEVIERALHGAKVVVVLWSSRSVGSRWVRSEATVGDRHGKLVPATIEPCERPVAFELAQTANLAHWQGDRGDPEWRRFVEDVRATRDGEPVVREPPRPAHERPVDKPRSQHGSALGHGRQSTSSPAPRSASPSAPAHEPRPTVSPLAGIGPILLLAGGLGLLFIGLAYYASTTALQRVQPGGPRPPGMPALTLTPGPADLDRYVGRWSPDDTEGCASPMVASKGEDGMLVLGHPDQPPEAHRIGEMALNGMYFTLLWEPVDYTGSQFQLWLSDRDTKLHLELQTSGLKRFEPAKRVWSRCE